MGCGASSKRALDVERHNTAQNTSIVPSASHGGRNEPRRPPQTRTPKGTTRHVAEHHTQDPVVDEEHVPEGVMISYSHANTPFALELEAALVQAGFKVWIDTKITPGEDWRANIAEAIELSFAVVVVLSPTSVTSKYCREEVFYAAQTRRAVFPVVSLDCWSALKGGLKMLLQRIQWLNFERDTWSACFPKLVSNLKLARQTQVENARKLQARIAAGEVHERSDLQEWDVEPLDVAEVGDEDDWNSDDGEGNRSPMAAARAAAKAAGTQIRVESAAGGSFPQAEPGDVYICCESSSKGDLMICHQLRDHLRVKGLKVYTSQRPQQRRRRQQPKEQDGRASPAMFPHGDGTQSDTSTPSTSRRPSIQPGSPVATMPEIRIDHAPLANIDASNHQLTARSVLPNGVTFTSPSCHPLSATNPPPGLSISIPVRQLGLKSKHVSSPSHDSPLLIPRPPQQDDSPKSAGGSIGGGGQNGSPGLSVRQDPAIVSARSASARNAAGARRPSLFGINVFDEAEDCFEANAAHIEASTMVIVIVSVASLKSVDCTDELHHAYELSKPMLQVRTDSSPHGASGTASIRNNATTSSPNAKDGGAASFPTTASPAAPAQGKAFDTGLLHGSVGMMLQQVPSVHWETDGSSYVELSSNFFALKFKLQAIRAAKKAALVKHRRMTMKMMKRATMNAAALPGGPAQGGAQQLGVGEKKALSPGSRKRRTMGGGGTGRSGDVTPGGGNSGEKRGTGITSGNSRSGTPTNGNNPRPLVVEVPTQQQPRTDSLAPPSPSQTRSTNLAPQPGPSSSQIGRAHIRSKSAAFLPGPAGGGSPKSAFNDYAQNYVMTLDEPIGLGPTAPHRAIGMTPILRSSSPRNAVPRSSSPQLQRVPSPHQVTQHRELEYASVSMHTGDPGLGATPLHRSLTPVNGVASHGGRPVSPRENPPWHSSSPRAGHPSPHFEHTSAQSYVRPSPEPPRAIVPSGSTPPRHNSPGLSPYPDSFHSARRVSDGGTSSGNDSPGPPRGGVSHARRASSRVPMEGPPTSTSSAGGPQAMMIPAATQLPPSLSHSRQSSYSRQNPPAHPPRGRSPTSPPSLSDTAGVESTSSGALSARAPSPTNGRNALTASNPRVAQSPAQQFVFPPPAMFIDPEKAYDAAPVSPQYPAPPVVDSNTASLPSSFSCVLGPTSALTSSAGATTMGQGTESVRKRQIQINFGNGSPGRKV